MAAVLYHLKLWSLCGPVYIEGLGGCNDPLRTRIGILTCTMPNQFINLLHQTDTHLGLNSGWGKYALFSPNNAVTICCMPLPHNKNDPQWAVSGTLWRFVAIGFLSLSMSSLLCWSCVMLCAASACCSQLVCAGCSTCDHSTLVEKHTNVTCSTRPLCGSNVGD